MKAITTLISCLELHFEKGNNRMIYKAIKPVNDELLHINGVYPECAKSKYQWKLDSISYDEMKSHLVEVRFSKIDETMTR